jgi:putative ABC transport system substrate-binding protein
VATPFGSDLSNLAHPGGNITGLSFDAGADLWGKRLEMLGEALPKLHRVAFMGPQAALDGAGGKVTREAAVRLGIDLVNASEATPIEEKAYRNAFQTMGRDQPMALYSQLTVRATPSGMS